MKFQFGILSSDSSGRGVRRILKTKFCVSNLRDHGFGHILVKNSKNIQKTAADQQDLDNNGRNQWIMSKFREISLIFGHTNHEINNYVQFFSLKGMREVKTA